MKIFKLKLNSINAMFLAISLVVIINFILFYNIAISFTESYLNVFEPHRVSVRYYDIDYVFEFTSPGNISFGQIIAHFFDSLGSIPHFYVAVSYIGVFHGIVLNNDATILVVGSTTHFDNLTYNTLYVVEGELSDNVRNITILSGTSYSVYGISSTKPAPEWLSKLVGYGFGFSSKKEGVYVIRLRSLPIAGVPINNLVPDYVYFILDLVPFNVGVPHSPLIDPETIESGLQKVANDLSGKGVYARLFFPLRQKVYGVIETYRFDLFVLLLISILSFALIGSAVTLYIKRLVKPSLSREIRLIESLGYNRLTYVLKGVWPYIVLTGSVSVLSMMAIQALTAEIVIPQIYSLLTLNAVITATFSGLMTATCLALILRSSIATYGGRRTLLAILSIAVVATVVFARYIVPFLMILAFSRILMILFSSAVAGLMSALVIKIVTAKLLRLFRIFINTSALALVVLIVLSLAVFPAIQATNSSRVEESIINGIFIEGVDNITFIRGDTPPENLPWYAICGYGILSIGNVSFAEVTTHSSGLIEYDISVSIPVIVVSDEIVRMISVDEVLNSSIFYVPIEENGYLRGIVSEIMRLNGSSGVMASLWKGSNILREVMLPGNLIIFTGPFRLWVEPYTLPEDMPMYYFTYLMRYPNPVLAIPENSELARTMMGSGECVYGIINGVNNTNGYMLGTINFDKLRQRYATWLGIKQYTTIYPAISYLASSAALLAVIYLNEYATRSRLYRKLLMSVGVSNQEIAKQEIVSIFIVVTISLLTYFSLITVFGLANSLVALCVAALSAFLALLYLILNKMILIGGKYEGANKRYRRDK